MILREYQASVIDRLKSSTCHASLLVAPTGSGKTVIAADIIRHAENWHTLFLAHRRELIRQTREHLAEFDVGAGVIIAGQPLDLMQRVQVASIQTLWSRCIRGNTDMPHADLVFVDEAHHARARTYRIILERFPNARIIGMTATPCRKDRRGLGNVFDELVECPQVHELIELGFLVPTTVFAPTTPDLRGVHTRHGDYVEHELAERMDRAELVGDIVSHWHRLNTERRKTVVFATSVGHSIHLCEEFVKSGVKAAHIDGRTPKDDRDEILRQLRAGEIELVSNCMVLTEGWDEPSVSCCVLARPTRSMGLYRQMAGRVIRPYEGKADALILDHAGATFRHGFIEDPVAWTLDEDQKAECPAHDARQSTPTTRIVECSQCQAVRTAGQPCGHCGFMPKRAAEYVRTRDGQLHRLDRNGSHPHLASIEEKQNFYRGLLYLALARGNRIGAAAYRYKDRFNEWPLRSWAQLAPVPPSAEVAAFDRHCRIKYAKAMQKASANG